jgi:RHS repeat-associated protein
MENLKWCFHRNQQYSVAAVTDGSGIISERYAYSAYGSPTITNGSGTARTMSEIGNRYTYTGREWDETLAMYHYRARMYDSVGGRFVSRDPIGYLLAKYHIYRNYSGLSKTDPSGLAPNIPTTARPRGNGGCWDIDLDDWIDWYEQQGTTFPQEVLDNLHRGCIGMCSVCQSCPLPGGGRGPISTFPEDAPNTSCFKTEAEARAVDCGDKAKFVFAKQGSWRNGDPTPSPDGTVPNDSVGGNGCPGCYNYISTREGWYIWMNHGEGLGAGPQVVTVCDRPVNDPTHYPNEIWCATCKGCKK